MPGDRVVALRFAGPRGGVALVAELTGRHGNLFLVGADGIIRASAGRNLSAAPRPRPGPALRRAGAAGPETASRARGRFAARRRRRASRSPPRSRRPTPRSRRSGSSPTGAAACASRCAPPSPGPAAPSIRLADEAARVPAAEADRRTGELLARNLGTVRRGAREVVLTEWTAEGAARGDGRPRSRPLAPGEPGASIPALPPDRRVRRARRGARRGGPGRARARSVRSSPPSTSRVRATSTGSSARRAGSARRRARPPRRRRKRDEPAPPYRTFRSAAGLVILVGRGPEENDALTVRVARGNDLWLHARGLPGAHVVVRVEKGRAPDQETLLDAAHLAVHFSDARGAPQAEVAATRAKHVRKPKGAAPGAVTYSQEKVTPAAGSSRRADRAAARRGGAGVGLEMPKTCDVHRERSRRGPLDESRIRAFDHDRDHVHDARPRPRACSRLSRPSPARL